ncbi:MAG: fluoride efflux transporter CrcB [Candidatus Omnitrophota bacterium]
MSKLLFVFAGGGIGTLCRYGLSLTADKIFKSDFPLGTLIVNLIGSFLIGFFWGIMQTKSINSNEKAFLFIGFLGGFTTFSTFMLENLTFIQNKANLHVIGNILGCNILGILLVLLGFYLSHTLIMQRV